LRLAPEREARVGRAHAVRGALQQARGQLAFKAADLLAQRRRHHAKLHRRTAHAAVFDHANEVTKLA